MSRILYLYGFLPENTSTPSPDVTGLEDRPVEVIQLEGFAAAVSRLPRTEYDEATLEGHVQDLRWMAHRGFLHERVVTWFVDREGILPARFLTLHDSDESLRNEADRRRALICDLLLRLEGRREWDLKVTYDAEVLVGGLGDESPGVARLDREIEDSSPGRAYLLQRRRDELAREKVVQVALEIGSRIVDELAPHAERTRRLPTPRSEKGAPRVAVHAAFLVARTREADLGSKVESDTARLAGRGVEIHLTGPWAPYRFVEELEKEGKDGRA